MKGNSIYKNSIWHTDSYIQNDSKLLGENLWAFLFQDPTSTLGWTQSIWSPL